MGHSITTYLHGSNLTHLPRVDNCEHTYPLFTRPSMDFLLTPSLLAHIVIECPPKVLDRPLRDIVSISPCKPSCFSCNVSFTYGNVKAQMVTIAEARAWNLENTSFFFCGDLKTPKGHFKINWPSNKHLTKSKNNTWY